jgi:hypothetical protein
MRARRDDADLPARAEVGETTSEAGETASASGISESDVDKDAGKTASDKDAGKTASDKDAGKTASSSGGAENAGQAESSWHCVLHGPPAAPHRPLPVDFESLLGCPFAFHTAETEAAFASFRDHVTRVASQLPSMHIHARL